LGDVRTTNEEFKALDEDGQAWWMHEACMEKGDINDYFGGQKEYTRAKQAASEVEAEKVKLQQQEWAQIQAVYQATQVAGELRQSLAVMPVEQLRQHLFSRGLPHIDLIDKDALLQRALQQLANVPPAVQVEAAWMPVGAQCKFCQKVNRKEFGGAMCRRVRANGTTGGCNIGTCWRCMKRETKEQIGAVRCTQEEFEELGMSAWWMHERCMMPQDRADYFAEVE